MASAGQTVAAWRMPSALSPTDGLHSSNTATGMGHCHIMALTWFPRSVTICNRQTTYTSGWGSMGPVDRACPARELQTPDPAPSKVNTRWKFTQTGPWAATCADFALAGGEG